jgi:hypothetical protein
MVLVAQVSTCALLVLILILQLRYFRLTLIDQTQHRTG